jgi:hypothetical protein
MLTLKFVRPDGLVASLNFNGSFYKMAIIKQNNMTHQYKVIFYIRDWFQFGFGVGNYMPVTHPITVLWNRGIPKPNQKGENPSYWVWFGRVTTGVGFVVMPNNNAQIH